MGTLSVRLDKAASCFPALQYLYQINQSNMESTNDNFPPSFDFQKERKSIDQLIADWSDEETKVLERRKLRQNKRNVADEQQLGTILKDETIIPDRTINTNIHRGRVPYINYITQSKRLLIIEDIDHPSADTEPFELWFTRGMRYPHWKIPWFKLVDAMHTHGGASFEVVYDDEKPFNCSIEYIPRDSLIFHKKTRDIQDSPRLLRKYEVSILQLSEFAEQFQFNKDAVDQITTKHKNNDDLIVIYKELFKRQGLIFNAWYSKDINSTWLRDPQPHQVGLFEFDPTMVQQFMQQGTWEQVRQPMQQPLPLKKYPIFWFPYDVTEDEEILQTQGRVSLDLHVQEALTHVVTNTVNATTRASNFYPTAEGQPGEDAKLEELGPLKPGVVLSGKVTTFQPVWPNNIMLSVSQFLDQRKSQETGNTDFAAIARKDANKTATEMDLSVKQAESLNVTELDIFSSPFMDVLALCFKIATHQAIFLLCKPPPNPQMLFGDYHLAPAGDVEVLQRDQNKQNAKEFFNIVKGTPIAEKIFAFLMQHYFPDEAEEWLAIMAAPDKDQLITQLVNILQSIPTDELTPEQRTSLRAIIIAAQNVVGGTDDQKISPMPPPAPAEPPAQGNAPQ